MPEVSFKTILPLMQVLALVQVLEREHTIQMQWTLEVSRLGSPKVNTKVNGQIDSGVSQLRAKRKEERRDPGVTVVPKAKIHGIKRARKVMETRRCTRARSNTSTKDFRDTAENAKVGAINVPTALAGIRATCEVLIMSMILHIIRARLGQSVSSAAPAAPAAALQPAQRVRRVQEVFYIDDDEDHHVGEPYELKELYIRMIENEREWKRVGQVSGVEHSIMIDFGSDEHCCGYNFMPEIPIERSMARLRDVREKRIKNYGQKPVVIPFESERGECVPFEVTLQVASIPRGALLSLVKLWLAGVLFQLERAVGV